MNRYIKKAIRDKVLKIANGYCEYCKCRDDFATDYFEFDHILPISKGGNNDFENIARSCGFCNGLKSDKQHNIDPLTKQEAPLFHPRKQSWETHFEWSKDFKTMIGKTSTGRATIHLLKLNSSTLVNIRTLLLLVKKHPPK